MGREPGVTQHYPNSLRRKQVFVPAFWAPLAGGKGAEEMLVVCGSPGAGLPPLSYLLKGKKKQGSPLPVGQPPPSQPAREETS